MASSPNSQLSRASSFNMGSIIERSMSPQALGEREREEKLEAHLDRAPSPFPFKPITPRPIQPQPVRSWANTPLRRKPAIENFRTVTLEKVEFMYSSPSKQPPYFPIKSTTTTREPGEFVREQMAMPSVVGQGIQAFATKRESRRVDRVSGGTGESARTGGQMADMDKQTDVFTKNRERRRAERYSAGWVKEVARAMLTGGGKDTKDGNGEMNGIVVKKDFGVESESIAAGSTWERRMKKGQTPAKKTPSDRYHQEEREKYWSPK